MLFSECSILSQGLGFTVTACSFLSFRLGGYEQLPDLRHTFSTLAIQSGVDAKTVAGMLGHYSAAFTLDTYTHVTEQMKRGAAEKIGVFMNASVNVQVNVVHSPSAVVRGDYESDLANCLNPSNSTDLDPTSQ